MGLQSANDLTHWKRAEDLGNFKESELSWVQHRKKTVDFRLLAETLGRCRTRWGGGLME